MKRLAAVALTLALAATAATAVAAPGTGQRVRDSGELRVCIWPDYYGISLRNPRTGQLAGIDIDLSAAFAADLKVTPRYVDSSFATLIDDLCRTAATWRCSRSA